MPMHKDTPARGGKPNLPCGFHLSLGEVFGDTNERPDPALRERKAGWMPAS